jgi:hypothetical protein
MQWSSYFINEYQKIKLLKRMKSFKLLLSFLLVCSVAVFISSCSEKEEPATLPPAINFTDTDGVASGERGAAVPIEVNLTAQGGIKSLTANGADVPVTVGGIQQTVTFTYNVGANETFGEKTIEFILTDNKSRPANATFKVTVVGSTINLSSLATAGLINTAVSLEAENAYILDVPITVQDGGILNIEPGTIIKAKTANLTDPIKKVNLIIAATGKINAVGSVTQPIVFTSDKDIPAPGDWQGVRINGTAANPDQGTFRYVRIEYGGRDQAGAKEGAFRISGVRAPTKIEYIQVFKSEDEGVRYRDGSTVHLNNIVITECGSRHLHVRDAGTAGTFQFIIMQSRNLSVLLDADGTTEVRPLEVRDATGVISNFTILGPGVSATVSDASKAVDGVRIRSSVVSVKMFNGLVAEFPDDGVRVDKTGITDINGTPVLAHSYVFRTLDAPTRDDAGTSLAFETNAAFNNVINKTDVPAAAAGITVDSYVPTATIASTYNSTSLGAAFASASYVGAIGATDWTKGWVRNPNGQIRP